MSVVLAHRNASVAAALALMLEHHGSLSVNASVSQVKEIVPAVRSEKPTLVLVDPLLPDLDLPALVRFVEDTVPGAGVAVMAGLGDTAFLGAAVDSGARAFLSLNAPAEELVRDLELAAAGQVVVSSPAADSLADLAPSSRGRPDRRDLSEREVDVIHHVAGGATNREIATALLLTENTVKVHMRNIFRKLELRNRQELTAYAHREGLVASGATGNTPK